MPIIRAEGPPIENLDTKRAFVGALTAAAVEAFKLPRETIVVLLRETRPDNVGVGGQLVIDRPKPEPAAE